MYQDLSELVKGALRAEGCDEALISNFDGHSTIELNFSTIPSILISRVDDDVMLWTRLAEHNAYTLEQSSTALLNLLLEPVAYASAGHFFLCEDQGFTVLKSLVKSSALVVEEFSNVLEEFYLAVEKYGEVLR